MKPPVKVSCVSYLNSKPFMFGLTNHSIINDINLTADNPADCAYKLINNIADIGLVPVASIPMIPNAEIISNFCISSDKEVKSVLLLSDVPLNEMQKITLDYQSLTSRNLVKILAQEFWKINVAFENAQPGYENKIAGANAALVIGDRALKIMDNYKFVYDLASEWNKFTGLPFVFACWVSNKKLDNSFVKSFNEALQFGVSNIKKVVNELASGNDAIEMEMYFTKNLNFLLDETKRNAIALFQSYIKNLTPEPEHC